MSRLLYNLLVILALPFVSLAVLWRGVADRAWWQSWPERFGMGEATALRGALWIHAASVGEVQVAATLVGALREREPQARILLTTATPAGRARARQLCPGVIARLVPYDLPWLMRRAVRRLMPAALVIIETELWPNLLRSAAALGIPVLMVSARISARSAGRLQAMPGLLQPALQQRFTVLAQTDADAARFRALGVPAGQVSTAGNLKFDFAVPPETLAAGRALRVALAPRRALWVAASTHAGEEQAALAAQVALRSAGIDALLVIAPRHSRRFDEVSALLDGAGVKVARRSRGEPAADAEVLLLDSIGELLQYLAAADLAFVGGSLVPVGGHNLLEPAALGVAMVTGPLHTSAPDVYARLSAAGAVRTAGDAAELAAAVPALMQDAPARKALADAASAVLAAARGALPRALEAISAQQRQS